MAKFHINKHGVPAPCRAKEGNCPLGGDEQHYNSKREAEEALNKQNEDKFGLLPKTQLENIFSNSDFEILNKLNNSGHQAYFVGGSLRDALIGLSINDVDISTSATPEETIEVFSDYQVLPIGLEHGTVVVMVDNEPMEITTFRRDGEYSDSRRPDNVEFTKSLESDVNRRDFTINALAYSEQEGLVDFVGGQKDIEDKLIRAVGNANDRFKEDPLRIMRGLRFASKLRFQIEEETENAIFDNKHLLNKISAERLQVEFNGLLMGDNCKEVLSKYSSVISEFIPEIKGMIGFDQKNPHHSYDLWEHSTFVINNAPNELEHKLAGLFHDIGKPNTFIYNEDKQLANYIGHADKSIKITEDILTRLKYPNKVKERVLNIIKDHSETLSTKPYKIKKFIYENGPERFNDMIKFKRADDLSKNLNFKNDLYKYDVISKAAKDYLNNNPILSHKDLDISAKEVMNLGYKGKDIGVILKELSLLVISGHKNDKESLIKYLSKNRQKEKA